MTFTSIAIALVIGFLYYVADAVGLALAKGEALLPWEGAWLTPILFTLMALIHYFQEFLIGILLRVVNPRKAIAQGT